jgi:RimJ/RimL family protein N-acetyltransferase
MIRGQRVGLRARREEDVPVLHAELYDDVATLVRSDTRPYRPIGPGHSPYMIAEPSDSSAPFSVIELANGELAGEAVVWGIDQFHRFAHLGMSLRPSFRGRGLGVDLVRTLCYYAFTVRGLHRLQLETLADNDAMRKAAERCGFVREGTLRRASWVTGDYVDEVILGLLADEWQAAPTA